MTTVSGTAHEAVNLSVFFAFEEIFLEPRHSKKNRKMGCVCLSADVTYEAFNFPWRNSNITWKMMFGISHPLTVAASEAPYTPGNLT